MVKKIKWPTLMTQIDAQDIFDDSEQELTYIDDKINELTKSMSAKQLTDLMKYIDNNFLKPSGAVWADLSICLSSYVEYDRRFILLLKNKLREYMAFYRKILTDSGVQRALVYDKTYSNEGSASSIERGTDSVTPNNSGLYPTGQESEDTLFDKAIADYASSLDKKKASSESSSSGGSTTNVTGVTWEEGKRNLQLMFFNELKEYIMSIPDRIYSYYSLDTLPLPELCRTYIRHIYEVEDIDE